MQTAIMSRRSYSVNSCNKTSKTNRKNRIETVQYYGVCMYVCLYVCLYVWEDGCTVCMCVHVCLNICLCVHDTFTAVSTIEIRINIKIYLLLLI